MGISGLLPALKSITETKSLEEYRGKTLAIDGYCWLHRAIYSCSQEICLGQETDKYVNYFLERVDMLLHNGITPYVVFDGGPLPMKKGTETERRAAREKNRELGIQFFKQKNYSEARKHFSRAADVSPYMAHRVIQRLKARKVRYVVAPYEADAQLAYLTKNGLADGVITEDSDCLPFGCGTVLFKLDKDGVGLAQEIKTSNLKHNKGLLFHMFTHEMFLEMCIFSGCDYLPSLPGFGLKKAYATLKQHGSFTKVIRALRLEGKVRIPTTYEADFEKAMLTFRHQRVFDPVTQQLVHLTPIPSNIETSCAAAMDFLGPMLASDAAVAIAHGDMDPITMETFSAHAPTPFVMVAPAPTGFVRPSAFQHNRYAATAAAQAQSRKPTHSFAAAQQEPQGRRLPSSFTRKPDSSPPSIIAMLQAQNNTSAAGSSVVTRGLETSPQVVSRFFAGQPKRASSMDESEDAIALSASSFKSQEPLEVDVARSVSLTPVEEKTRAHGVVFENKENTTPPRGAVVSRAPLLPSSSPSLSSSVPAPVVKENAFSRMMRAGSLLQKQSLKRKAAGASSFRHGKQTGGLFGRHHRQQLQHRPVEQRIQQFVHIETTQSRVVVTTTGSASDVTSTTMTAESEAASDIIVMASTEPEAEESAAVGESESQDSDSVVARGSCLVAAAHQTLPSRGKAIAGDVPTATNASASLLSSLDRFRFKQ